MKRPPIRHLLPQLPPTANGWSHPASVCRSIDWSDWYLVDVYQTYSGGINILYSLKNMMIIMIIDILLVLSILLIWLSLSLKIIFKSSAFIFGFSEWSYWLKQNVHHNPSSNPLRIEHWHLQNIVVALLETCQSLGAWKLVDMAEGHGCEHVKENQGGRHPCLQLGLPEWNLYRTHIKSYKDYRL